MLSQCSSCAVISRVHNGGSSVIAGNCRSTLRHTDRSVNPIAGTGNYSATSNGWNMKLVHWPSMGWLYNGPLLCRFNVAIEGLNRSVPYLSGAASVIDRASHMACCLVQQCSHNHKKANLAQRPVAWCCHLANLMA